MTAREAVEGKYTNDDLKGLSTDALIVLYAVKLLDPLPVTADRIMKTVVDCRLHELSREKLIEMLTK